jgi:hypothetical protein
MAMTETFHHRGESWRRIGAVARDRFFIGVDLGQSVDPTAICVLHHHVTPLDEWTSSKSRRVIEQQVTERFDVRHLERMKLNLPYPEIIEYLTELLSRHPLIGAELVLDETGVGRPVCDEFDKAELYPIRVSITAGMDVTKVSPRKWHVPKGVLISNLDAKMHTGELRFAAELREAGAMAEELKDFRRKVGQTGRLTFGARVTKHDDLVLACAIAVWRASARLDQIHVGTLTGLNF